MNKGSNYRNDKKRTEASGIRNSVFQNTPTSSLMFMDPCIVAQII